MAVNNSTKPQPANKTFLVTGVVILLVAAIAVILYIVISSKAASDLQAANLASEQNVRQIEEWMFTKDPSLCEKVSGGIKAADVTRLSSYGAAFDNSENQDLTESETRARCKELVEDIIGR